MCDNNVVLLVAHEQGVDYLKLDSCGGYEKNYTSDPVGRQYANYAAMRDALNATGRAIYYSICEINKVVESKEVKSSPSACGHTSAYTSLPWHAQPDKYPVPELANSVLIEWVNNNNHFCVPGGPRASTLSLQQCEDGNTAQQFTIETDGSIRHQGQSTQCLDVYNCQKADGELPPTIVEWRSSLALYQLHTVRTQRCIVWLYLKVKELGVCGCTFRHSCWSVCMPPERDRGMRL